MFLNNFYKFAITRIEELLVEKNVSKCITWKWISQLAVSDEYTRREEISIFRVTTSILVKRKKWLKSTVIYCNLVTVKLENGNVISLQFHSML